MRGQDFAAPAVASRADAPSRDDPDRPTTGLISRLSSEPTSAWATSRSRWSSTARYAFATNGITGSMTAGVIPMATFRWPRPDPVGAAAHERIRLGRPRLGPLVAGAVVRSPQLAGPPRDAEMVAPSRAEQSPETAPVTRSSLSGWGSARREDRRRHRGSSAPAGVTRSARISWLHAATSSRLAAAPYVAPSAAQGQRPRRRSTCSHARTNAG
jgi:hypothetical protein